ncbi:Zn-dependent hydrolase, glyoxylase [Frankia sp. AiPs1]|uniref:AtzH-like domain-containing protein n=1 Tax=Frankia sp. AiPa1 TaxID=573492 RepID=UPI00202AF7EA|nr:AtzH-like domain-containing protein [Frankia sp. AiPa1]MCL9761417.1 DUF3225 domain-containing protein [Frankia sp. AiPa1]
MTAAVRPPLAAADWFALHPLAARTWLVAEPGHVNCFLVEGDERAVLVDTGLGLADIHAAARTLTDRPILAVNSHGHDDHRGGNWLFDDVAAHPDAARALTEAVPAERLAAYLRVAREQYAAYVRLRDDDGRFFHQFTAETTPRPVPPAADAWTVPAGPAPGPLRDGQRLDLGGRELTVLHTPGHSPDSLCLLDERAGLLFAGDTLITGDFWVHQPDAAIEMYAATLRALHHRVDGAVREIYPAHTLRYRVGPDFLRRAADAFEQVVAGRVRGRPGTDLLRRPVQRHDFADFSILRPPVPAAASAVAHPVGSASIATPPDPATPDPAPPAPAAPAIAAPAAAVPAVAVGLDRAPDPDVPAELRGQDSGLGEAFVRYERALMAGDVDIQREMFTATDDVVRVDPAGAVIGPAALAAYRASRPTPGPRRLRALHTVRSPGETVVTVSTNERLDPRGLVTGQSVQTQVWARTGDGWRVIAASVTPLDHPAPSDHGGRSDRTAPEDSRGAGER